VKTKTRWSFSIIVHQKRERIRLKKGFFKKEKKRKKNNSVKKEEIKTGGP